jgi:hypothetical protein
MIASKRSPLKAAGFRLAIAALYQRIFGAREAGALSHDF